MAYKITETDESPLIRVDFFGQVTDEQVTEALQGLLKTEGYEYKHQLVDMTGIEEFNVTNPGLIEYAETFGQQPARIQAMNQRKTALVAPEDLTYASAKLLIAYMNEWTNNIQVFRSKEAALAWIAE